MNIKQKWGETKENIKKNKNFRKFNIYLKRLVLPGFEGIPFLEVMRFFIESLVKGILFQRAAAMTYRIFIALIPMLMALFAAISFLDESIRIQLMDFIHSMVPEYTWPAISNVISGVVMKQNGLLLYSSIGIGLYLSVISMNSVVTSLNITYFKIQTRSILRQFLVCIVMILVLFLIIILAVAIFIGASFAINYINSHIFKSTILYTYGIKIFKWVFLFILAYLLLSLLFYFAPVNKKYFRFFSAGSTLSTIMLIILLYALNFYFYWFPTYNLIYGSIGALFAIMLWLYWSSIMILIGFDLNVSIFVAKQSKTKTQEITLKSTISPEDMEI